MKVLVVDTVDPILINGLKELGFQVDENYSASVEEIKQIIKEYSGMIIRSRFPVNRDFLLSTELKFIGRVGAGMENIDHTAAAEKNIKLLSAPEGNRDAVGEHALGMLLMLFNNLRKADREVGLGEWKREANRGFEVGGKTVGIIGYGNMGSAFAEKLSGFGANVIAYDRYKRDFGSDIVEEVSLEELKQRAEIISLHTPQTKDTIGMVNESFINSFDNSFYIINTARGKAIKTEDLVEGLKSGKVKGACLDVLEYEKSSFENMFTSDLPQAFQYLIESEKVILSPHIAGWSQESNQKMAEVIVRKVKSLNLLG